MSSRRWLGPAIATLVSALLFFGLRMSDRLDIRLFTPTGHFYIVSAVSFLSTAIAIVVGIVGSRLRNIKIIFLSLAYISLALMFLIHGLSTPDFLIHTTHLPGVSAQLSVLFASVWLWMSSLHSDHSLIGLMSRWNNVLMPLWTIALALFGTIGLVYTDLVQLLPVNQDPLKGPVSTIVFLLNIVTAYRYYTSYRYSRFPLQLAIVYSAGWLEVSQMIMMLGETWRLSWWIYHFLLLFSMLMMIGGLVRQYGSYQSLTLAFKGLFTTDPIERVTCSLSPSVKALILATESRDTYTAGHNFRVTLYALKLAEEMAIGPDQMRALAQGTIVHDVGKINVPDAILNKPGKLTPEEREVIENHPVRGYEMCRSLGFMAEELEIIRSHHEKWNGSGYPDKLAGERIPLLARIVSIADVYDALTSSRSYRAAMSHEQAMEIINEGSGVHFSPVCVDAWKRVCDRDPQVYEYPSRMVGAQAIPGLQPPAYPSM